MARPPFSPVIEQLANDISKLTLLELRDLQTALLEKGIELQIAPAPQQHIYFPGA